MRGVPSIDDSGIHEFFDIVDRLKYKTVSLNSVVFKKSDDSI